MIPCNSPEPCIFLLEANAHRGNACGARNGKGRLKTLYGCHKHQLNPSKVVTIVKQARYKTIDVERLKELAKGDGTAKEIAATMGVHVCSVHNWNTKLKLGIKKAYKYKIDINVLRKMAKAGKYRIDMAKEFGCDRSHITAIANKAGIKITNQPHVRKARAQQGG